MNTRSDIDYTVQLLSRFLCAPTLNYHGASQ